MKVVLIKELDNLGEADTVHKVRAGYARNLLLPKNLAVPATKGAVAAAEKRLAEREKKLEAKRAEFETLAKKLSEIELEFEIEAGEGGKLFGSVTNQNLVDAIKEKSGEEVKKRKIHLSQHVKAAGDYIATVKIFKEIVAEIKVKVVAKKIEEKPAE